jgi:hypothetical protein
MLDMNDEGPLKQPVPRLAFVDLNLLTVFDAVMRERSTTRSESGWA